MSKKDKLVNLHEQISDYFLSKIASGDVSAADVNNMLKFLKDNGVNSASIKNPKLQAVAEKLSESISDEMLTQLENEMGCN